MIAVTLDEWKRKLDFPTGETVILHNPKVKMNHTHGDSVAFLITFFFFFCSTDS